jgi:PAS domain S-box-containing protein
MDKPKRSKRSFRQLQARVTELEQALDEMQQKLAAEGDPAIQQQLADLTTQNEVLNNRDRMLDTTAMAVNALLTINDFERSIDTALQILGEGLQIDRVSVLQNFPPPADSSFPYWQVMYEWNSPGTISQFSDPNATQGSYEQIQAFYATLQQGQILSYLVEDTLEPFRSYQMAIGVKSTQIVPIVVEGQWWGVLALDDCHEAKQRSLAEISLLKIAAACVGSAIDRQARTEELRQSEALYRSLFEISTEGIYRWQLDRPVALSLSVDEQVNHIYRHAYFVQANDAFAPMYGLEKGEDVVGLRIADTHPDKIEHTLDFIRAVVESNYRMSSAESAEVDANGQQRYFLNSIIGFRDRGYVTGGWGTQIDITELRTTQQALLQNERERAAELSKINAALRRCANHLTTTTSLQSFPIAVLKEAIAASGAVTAGSFVYSPSAHTLQMIGLVLQGEVIEIATDPRVEIWRLPIPADITNAWQMVAETQIFFSDIDNPHPEFWPFSIPWHRQFGHKEAATIPLSIGDNLVGILGLCFTTAQAQTKSELELFYTLGQHAALALRLTQLSEEAQQATLLAERNRMARELHDTLAQTFTGVIMQLEAAQELLADTPAPVCQHLAHAGLLARQGLNEARRSVWSLRPDALETDDLHTALLRLVQQMTDNTTIVTEVLVDGTPIALPEEVEAHLLRIGQEALTNILKHTQAQHIQLTLQFDSDSIALHVVDNGRGFDIDLPRSGFGLTSMQQRTHQIGGVFALASQIGQGTTITVKIPVSQLLWRTK